MPITTPRTTPTLATSVSLVVVLLQVNRRPLATLLLPFSSTTITGGRTRKQLELWMQKPLLLRLQGWNLHVYVINSIGGGSLPKLKKQQHETSGAHVTLRRPIHHAPLRT